MSWIYALSFPKDHGETSAVHDTALHAVSLPGFHLAIGGIPETCFFEGNTGTSSGWAVVGTGILVSGSSSSLMTHEDWRDRLSHDRFDASSIDGHFAAIRWRDDTVECFTDQLGLRPFFYGQLRDCICLSTRADWAARSAGRHEVDFFALGSTWLLLHPIPLTSGIRGIERLGPSGHAIAQGGNLLYSRSAPWLPENGTGTRDEAIEALGMFLRSSSAHPGNVSLGLSGDPDSRLLLALLSSMKGAGFATHSSGDPRDPDVQMAETLATAAGSNFLSIHEDEYPDVAECIKGLRAFILTTGLTASCTEYSRFRMYPKLREAGRFILESGFRELSAQDAVNTFCEAGDTGGLLKVLRCPRPAIFSPDVQQLLERGARESIEIALNTMPAERDLAAGNSADLFSVRTRIPNQAGAKQALLDGLAPGIMPFIQPSYLRALLRIPAGIRSGSDFPFDYIRRLNPALALHPIISNGYRIPFGLSPNLTRLYLSAQENLRDPFYDPGPDMFLAHLSDYALDLAHSDCVRHRPEYNTGLIRNAVTRYFRGELDYRNVVEWWLTFELWGS